MKFLTVLIVIFLYRNWIGDNPLRDSIGFDRYAKWFRQNISSPAIRFLACVGIPVVLVWLVSVELWQWAFGLPWLLLSLLVMVYAIDIVDADALFDGHAQTLQELDESADIEEEIRRQDEFKETAIYEVFQSLYPALFWFLLAGPAGALLYTLSREYLLDSEDDDSELSLVEDVVYWLEWPAAKVNGFLFALVGHFGKCFEEWLGSLFDIRQPIARGLTLAACAASGSTENHDSLADFVRTSLEHNFDLKELLVRLSFGWLGIAAIVVIFGL